MDDGDLSLSVETDHIGYLAGGKRAVFYDEMAQFGARYIKGHSVELASIDEEVRYHLNNLVLLSMYFDIIFIQTAAIFNVNDIFLRSIIQRTISHPKFRAMLKAGCIRICGWGGRSPREMYSNAFGFASMGITGRFSEDFAADLRGIFRPTNLTYRMQEHPEDEAAQFRKALRETEIVDSIDDLDRVERAIDQSERRLGALTTIAFFPALDLSSMRASSQRAVYSTFVNVWAEHVNQAVPGIHCYVAGTDAAAIQQVITIEGKRLRSFLFSPRIFAAFLKRYFNDAEFNRIMSRPYEDIHKLRNGDWKRFCDAYHAAVGMVSDSVSEMDFSMLEMFGFQNQAAWGAKIWDGANKRGSDFDANAFIQGLASISGTFIGIPLIGPAIHVAGIMMGRRINSFYDRLVREHGNHTSPYISKLRTNLAIQLSTA